MLLQVCLFLPDLFQKFYRPVASRQLAVPVRIENAFHTQFLFHPLL